MASKFTLGFAAWMALATGFCLAAGVYWAAALIGALGVAGVIDNLIRDSQDRAAQDRVRRQESNWLRRQDETGERSEDTRR